MMLRALSPPLLLLLLLLAGGAADPEPSATASQPTATEPKQPGDDMKTIVELVGGWPNLGGGVLAALLAVALVQWLFSLREASLDAAYKEREAARLAKLDEYRKGEIAKMREARLAREAEQAKLKAVRDAERAVEKEAAAKKKAENKKAAEAEMRRRRAQLGGHVQEAMAAAAAGPVADIPAKVSTADATIKRVGELKSGQLKAILRSLELDAKGSTKDLKDRLLRAAASSGSVASAVARHPNVATAPASPTSAPAAKKKKASPRRSLVKATGKFPAESVVVHWTGRERKETIDVAADETVGGLKTKISANVVSAAAPFASSFSFLKNAAAQIFANPTPASQKLVYSGRVLQDDTQKLVDAKIADGSAVHLVVTAAPASPLAAGTGGGSGSGLLSGCRLIKKQGTVVPASSLQGKVVALYFSAHWW